MIYDHLVNLSGGWAGSSYISQQQIKMERPKGSTGEVDEDVVEAVVKAAAWAWYVRQGSLSTSGSSEPAGSTKVMQEEVSIRRRIHPSTPPQPRPSRFKLEAINNMMQQPQPPPEEEKEEEEEEEEDKQLEHSNNKSSCNYSSLQLLDAYEIERISKHLENLLIITSSTSSGSGVEDEAANSSSSISRFWGAKQQIMGMASSPSPTTTGSAAPAATNMVDTRRDANKEKKSKGWFGFMRHNGRICGVNEESSMVKTVLVHQHRRRKPEKHI